MNQEAFTIATEISEDSLETLTALLKNIGTDIEKDKSNSSIDFFDYDRLHYCSFFIIKGDIQYNAKDLLVFEANIDGDVKSFLTDMVKKDFDFIFQVYQYCEGHPSDDKKENWEKYLVDQNKGYNAFFRGHPKRSRNEILFEQTLREEIETFLDDNEDSLSKKSASQVREEIQKFVLNDDELKSAAQIPEISFLIRYGNILFISLVLIVLAMLAFALIGKFGGLIQIIVVAFTLFYIYWLQNAETNDISFNGKLKNDRFVDVMKAEDIRLQNHLTSVIYVKPGAIRLYTLKVVLFAVNLLARLKATKGNLSGIVTIHFARWFIHEAGDGQHYMIFLSNYDGSWENYLGEFIDLASTGLTAIWSNTQQAKDEGFPKTKWLVTGGARHEQLFKTFARNSQYPELIWYAAYPDLSVKNVINNMQIRDQLFDSSVNPTEWLSRF